MTQEDGTVSGDLDVAVNGAGRGFVRYRGTQRWLTIGNLEGTPPRTWSSAAELAAAVTAAADVRDGFGNVVPFEA
ncbi:MAG: hypothetical protein HOQ24_10115 [Mycobacteriaceae bacterium]|nr:hypothetical protein [Mycobacteriaceae bacterium]